MTSAPSTNHAVTTMSHSAPAGTEAQAAAGRLSRKVDRGSQSRRAVSSGTPAKAARAAKWTGS
eukprot:554553-Alexandrium_andersonii.AAC.1